MAGDDRPHPLSERVVLSDPRVEWSGEFDVLAARLRSLLGERVRRIDHIGSTSVPGLAAKDVVDMQAIVDELEPEIVDALLAAGFVAPFGREALPDHVPGGAGDERQWLKLFAADRSTRPANVHIRRRGSANQRYALLFRDYLRANGEARGAWESVKRRLASDSATRDEYTLAKDPLTDELMADAEVWAAATGWQPPA